MFEKKTESRERNFFKVKQVKKKDAMIQIFSACLVITKKLFENSPDGIIRRKIEQQWRTSTFRLSYTSDNLIASFCTWC
jgi:hypothetical protein